MSLIDAVRAKARACVRKIVLPEGDEPRTVAAAAILRQEGIAEPILLEENYARIKADEYADALYELRKAKGLTHEKAAALVADPMYYGMMMVKLGDADGLVSGAVHSTGHMQRPALQIVKTRPGMKLVSSSMLLEFPEANIGVDGVLVFADCVVNPNPTAEELAHIAVAASETARTLCGFAEPRVAMLSSLTKVQQATVIAHALAPDLQLDGESDRANVFIFPDLQAGNIGYKIAQRLGHAQAFAVLQGLAKPCNDLSRGCSVEDIVNTVAMTAVQCSV